MVLNLSCVFESGNRDCGEVLFRCLSIGCIGSPGLACVADTSKYATRMLLVVPNGSKARVPAGKLRKSC